MKTQLTLNVLMAAWLMASCAQPGYKKTALDIRPLQKVQHSYEQAKAQYELGRYYHGQLRFGAAIEAYRRALELNPAMIEALNAMGVAYAESGNLLLSRQQFEAALTLQPASSYTYNNLGFVHYLAGDYPAAVEAYKQVLRLDSNHELSRQNLVLAYEKIGGGQQAARSERLDETVAPPQSTEKHTPADAQAAWIQITPDIYEMRSIVALTEQAVATPAVRPATRVASPMTHTVSAETVAMSRAAAPAAQSSMGAHATATPSPAIAASVKTVPPAIVAMPKKVQVVRAAIPLRGVEVSNGNGIVGMAAKMARYFSGKGIREARLTNQKPFVEHRTHIEYRPGNEAEAARINRLLPRLAPLYASRSLRPGIGVRLVLGHDLHQAISARDSRAEAGIIKAEWTAESLNLHGS